VNAPGGIKMPVAFYNIILCDHIIFGMEADHDPCVRPT
jgi:hypothetical protein